MAKGDIYETENGQRLIETESGFRPLEEKSPIESAIVGAGSVGDRGLQAIQELVGAISPAEAAMRASDRESMKQALGETNPVSNFLGRNIDEIPGMLPAGRGAQAVIGGLQGAIAPADSLSQRATNALLGAGLSVGGDVAGQVIGSMGSRVMRAIGATADNVTGNVARAAAGAGGAGGGGGGEVIETMADKARRFGLELSPGMQSGNKTLQRFDISLGRNPLTSGPFDRIKEANAGVINRFAADSIGVPADVLEAGGGKLSPSVLREAEARIGEQYEWLGQSIPDVKLPDGLRDAVLANRDIKKLVAGSDELFTRLESDGIISGPEYAKLRSALMKTARTEQNSDVAAMIAGQAQRLDKVVDNALPDGATVGPEFARMREQWRNLEVLQSPGVLASDGSVRPGMLNNRLRGNYGTTYLQEKFDLVQPETASLLELSKLVNSPDMMPIVGTSGTAEGLIGDRVTEEMAAAALNRDPGAIAQLMAKQRLGDLYMEQGRKNPEALAALLESPGNFVSELSRATGRTAGSEQGER